MVWSKLWIQHQGIGEAFAVLRYNPSVTHINALDFLHHYNIGKKLPPGYDIFMTIERQNIASQILFPDEIERRCKLIPKETVAQYTKYIADSPEQCTKVYLGGARCSACELPICKRLFNKCYGYCVLEIILNPSADWLNFGENIFLSKEIRMSDTDYLLAVFVNVKRSTVQCCVKAGTHRGWSVPFTVHTKCMVKVFCLGKNKETPTLFNLSSVAIIKYQHDEMTNKITQNDFKDLLPKTVISSIQQLEHLSLRFVA